MKIKQTRLKEFGFALYDKKNNRLLRNSAGVLFINSDEKSAPKARDILMEETLLTFEVKKIKIFYDTEIEIVKEIKQ